ncbi:MAG: hypothetical protein ACYS3S_00365 [Planctomycetota bacterium]|jgi:hypothetical protein
MITSKKFQQVLFLISVFACNPILAVDPNESKIEVKFEVCSKEQEWIIGKGNTQSGRGPIRPSHVAVLFMGPSQLFPDFGSPAVIKSIQSTSAGKSLSQTQVHLLSTGSGCISRLGRFGDTVPNHYHFRLYAVSENDARKLTEAFIEILTDQARIKAQPTKGRILDLKDKISQIEARIPEANAKVQTALSEFTELKKTVHYRSGQEAKKTISELNRILVTNDIDIAGIRAKITAIQEYKSKKRISEESHLAALDQMLSEQNIELAASLAKKKAATTARQAAERFCHLEENSKTPDHLATQLRLYKSDLQNLRDRLNRSDMIPPKVFRNEVTIYPVLTDQS